MAEADYISNMSENEEELDMEIVNRVNQLEIDNEKLKADLNDYKKENLEQKHRIQDLEIENDHNLETIKNQNGLIKFYKQYRTEHEEGSEGKKFSEYEERIRSLEESISIKEKKMLELSKELQEQSNLNEKLVDVITNKEEAIKKLEKGQNLEDETNSPNANITKLEEEIDNLKEKISDLENEKDKIVDKYDDKIKALNKENNDYQDKIYDYETEILNLKEANKKYEIDEAKKKGGDGANSDVEKLYKEEIENLKSALNEAKESKKQIKEKAQEQRDSDVKEIQDLEKAVDDLKSELNALKRNNQSLENDKKNMKKINEK